MLIAELYRALVFDRQGNSQSYYQGLHLGGNDSADVVGQHGLRKADKSLTVNCAVTFYHGGVCHLLFTA